MVVLLNYSQFRTKLTRATLEWIGLPKSQCEGQPKGLRAIHRTHPKVSHPDFDATDWNEGSAIRSGFARDCHTLPSLTVDNRSLRSVSAKEALT